METLDAMQIFTSHLGVFLLGALVYMGWLLRVISYRLGDVTRVASYYRGYDVGNVFVSIALLVYMMRCSAALVGEPVWALSEAFTLYGFYLPLTIGLVLNGAITFFYWGWLSQERALLFGKPKA